MAALHPLLALRSVFQLQRAVRAESSPNVFATTPLARKRSDSIVDSLCAPVSICSTNVIMQHSAAQRAVRLSASKLGAAARCSDAEQPSPAPAATSSPPSASLDRPEAPPPAALVVCMMRVAIKAGAGQPGSSRGATQLRVQSSSSTESPPTAEEGSFLLGSGGHGS